MTGPRISLEDALASADRAHLMRMSELLGVVAQRPDATATAIPQAALGADQKHAAAHALDAKATADSAALVNRPRTGDAIEDFAPGWVAGGGRFTSRDKATDAQAAAAAAGKRAASVIPPTIQSRRTGSKE